MEIAVRHNMDMEGACEGNMACSTCHVIVDSDWASKLSDPTEEEVRIAISGNLCRCTGYQSIVDATLDAAQRLGGGEP